MIGDSNLTNEELVKRCARGNRKACKQMYDQYAPQMMGVCMRYARSREDAQDLLQEGFIKVFANLGKLKDAANIGGWIRRIMVNVALNHLRRDARYHEDIDELQEFVADPAQDYDSLEMEYLLSLIQSLPAKYRIVFNMREVEGFSFEEISEALEIEQVSVRSILCRAKKILQEKIKNDER